MVSRVTFSWDTDRVWPLDKGFGSTFVGLDMYAEDYELDLGEKIDISDFLDDLAYWIKDMREAMAGPLEKQLAAIEERGELNEQGARMLARLRAGEVELNRRGFPLHWPDGDEAA